MDRPDETQAAVRDTGSGHACSRHSGSGDAFREFKPGAGFAQAGRSQPFAGDSHGREPETGDSETGGHAARDSRGVRHACRCAKKGNLNAYLRRGLVIMISLPSGSAHMARCAGSSGVSSGGRRTVPPAARSASHAPKRSLT